MKPNNKKSDLINADSQTQDLGSAVVERPEPPALDPEALETWEKALERHEPSKSRDGLRYLLGGWSYREAAKAVDCQFSTLWGFVQTHGYGMTVNKRDRVVQSFRSIQVGIGEEMLRRIQDEKLGDEKMRDLAVAAGVSVDKEAMLTGGAEVASAADSMRGIKSELLKRGATLSVTVGPAQDQGALGTETP